MLQFLVFSLVCSNEFILKCNAVTLNKIFFNIKGSFLGFVHIPFEKRFTYLSQWLESPALFDYSFMVYVTVSYVSVISYVLRMLILMLGYIFYYVWVIVICLKQIFVLSLFSQIRKFCYGVFRVSFIKIRSERKSQFYFFLNVKNCTRTVDRKSLHVY